MDFIRLFLRSCGLFSSPRAVLILPSFSDIDATRSSMPSVMVYGGSYLSKVLPPLFILRIILRTFLYIIH